MAAWPCWSHLQRKNNNQETWTLETRKENAASRKHEYREPGKEKYREILFTCRHPGTPGWPWHALPAVPSLWPQVPFSYKNSSIFGKPQKFGVNPTVYSVCIECIKIGVKSNSPTYFEAYFKFIVTKLTRHYIGSSTYEDGKKKKQNKHN